jgi:hypothetical protein
MLSFRIENTTFWLVAYSYFLNLVRYRVARGPLLCKTLMGISRMRVLVSNIGPMRKQNIKGIQNEGSICMSL